VASYQRVTARKFCPGFFLDLETRRVIRSNYKVFDGCDSVETDSPIEHRPGKTGYNAHSPGSGHFYLLVNIGVTLTFNEFAHIPEALFYHLWTRAPGLFGQCASAIGSGLGDEPALVTATRVFEADMGTVAASPTVGSQNRLGPRSGRDFALRGRTEMAVRGDIPGRGKTLRDSFVCDRLPISASIRRHNPPRLHRQLLALSGRYAEYFISSYRLMFKA